jgi:uncharacterized Zn-finger protein
MKAVEHKCLYCKTVFYFNDGQLHSRCPCCNQNPALIIPIPEKINEYICPKCHQRFFLNNGLNHKECLDCKTDLFEVHLCQK